MSGFNKLTSSQILRIYRAVEQTPLLEDFVNEGTFADFVASTWNIIRCRSIKTLQHILTAIYESLLQVYIVSCTLLRHRWLPCIVDTINIASPNINP